MYTKLAHTSNFKNGRSSQVNYIVIHFTANNGDNARGNLNYFSHKNERPASAHFFVDEKEYCQSVLESNTAYHCGGGRQGKNGGAFFGKCTNSNSIGIEMCSRMKDGKYYFKDETINNCIELVKHLMDKYNIPIDRVIRHYDVTGKICPAPFVNDVEWKKFKSKLLGVEDLTREETIKLVKEILNGNENGMTSLDKEWKDATERGITDGTRRSGYATREQVVAMILRSTK